MADLLYGVCGPGPRNTVVKAPSVDAAVEMVLRNEVVVVSRDNGTTWDQARIRVVGDEIRNYETNVCDDCGTGLVLPGWLCVNCAEGRGVRR